MIQSSTHHSITTLELVDQKVNAMDLEFCQSVNRVVEAFESSAAQVLVIRSRTPKGVFSAGIDLKRMLAEDIEYTRRYFPALIELFERIYFCSKPTLAVVEGVAIAGGCIMASACSARLITSNASFGMPSSDLDVPIPRLARDILRSVAPDAVADQFHAGRMFDASEVVACGMVSKVVEREELDLSIAVEAAEMMKLDFQPVQRDEARLAEFAQQDAEMVATWCTPELRQRVQEYLDTLRSSRSPK